MTEIWNRCQRAEASLNEIVAAFEADGDASELVTVARTEAERSGALYVLAELPTAISRPVWRCVLDYVADKDDRIAYYSLDIFHSFLAEADARELLIVVTKVRMESTALFAKLFAIMFSVPSELLLRGCQLARLEIPGTEHSKGLALLEEGNRVPKPAVLEMLSDSSVVMRFYGCCLVGRHHPREASLRRLLPEQVERRLAIQEG